MSKLIDKDQVLAELEEELKAAKVLPLHPMDIEGQEAHEEGIARVEWAIEFVAALPAIPPDRDPIEIVQQQAEEDFVEWLGTPEKGYYIGNCDNCGRFCHRYSSQGYEGEWNDWGECATGKGCKQSVGSPANE
jgi:hypothetical protein